MSARIYLAALLLLAFPLAAHADEAHEDHLSTVQQAWQMLDYLAPDYREAVRGGVIIDEDEYEEMREFSEAIAERMGKLPRSEAQEKLSKDAARLVTLIQDKADEDLVRDTANQLADDLRHAFPFPSAPEHSPSLERGKEIYLDTCATCHGETGAADGPGALGLDPPAIAFDDQERADERSILSLYQTLTQGVEDTSMIGYGDLLSEEDRWAVAYFSASLAYRDLAPQGESLWANNAQARALIGDLEELTHARGDQLSSVLSLTDARALIGYLRATPDALTESLQGLDLARGRLAASLKAYETGDQEDAVRLALSAYLDGVEPVEPRLDLVDRALRSSIERAMGLYRTGLSRQALLSDLQQQAADADALLVEAIRALDEAGSSATGTFLGAFAILLREGLEALLVVIALLAVIRKTGWNAALPYVHGGWIAAFVAGIATFFAARHLIEISGASREVTEGISALVAVVMLLGIGLWMHQKSIGNRWQSYIKAKMGTALNRRSAWLLFLLSFITVYREIFETILFYIALWDAEHATAFFAGIGAAALLLALIAFLMLRTSQNLPIGKFFALSSALIAIVAFILTGKGIKSLQEAGWIDLSLAPIPEFDLLGIYPTWQGLSAQGLILAVLILGMLYNRRQAQG